MGHNLILLTKAILIELFASSKPLIGHLVLYKNSLIKIYGLPSRLEPEVRIWMLEYPNSVEVVFKEEYYFLKS